MEEKQLYAFNAENEGGLNEQAGENQGPVTVLGMTFANDEERREYFREELRKKLPELRKIEGFPIGEDEDIIRLSDPPYYTACPNPWLNDFIAEWEEEKKKLEAEGKRKADFEVKEPYAYGIKQGKNSAIYNAHSYHTKVPHEVIMRYILHYSQPGDVVLDGFAGTGMTGVASTSCGSPTKEEKNEIEHDYQEIGYLSPLWGLRHSVCGDISPLCFHISSNYNTSVNINGLQSVVDEIIEKLNNRFGHFYEYRLKRGENEISYHINYFVWSQIVGCNNCGAELNVHDLSFNYETHKLYDNLICPRCGNEQKRIDALQIEETTYDEITNQSSSQLKYECCLCNYSIPKHGRAFSKAIPKCSFPEFVGYVPTIQLNEGDKFGDPKRVGANSVDKLYYKRTKYVLAYLYYIIRGEYKRYEKPLMFIFTSMLPKLTRMNRYMPQHGSRALVGPMANTLYIPPQSVENNPIDQFEYQASKILRAFKHVNNGCSIQIASATHSSMPSESVDYIFTDPPFGSNIMYSELNSVSESWLSVMTNNKEEAISNNSQHKGLPEYQQIMTECFREYHRVLKPGKWMTVEFSNTSASFWNALQYAIKNAGFLISAITDLNKERGGLHAMLGPTAVKQDLAISCYKPSEAFTKAFSNVTKPEELVWDFVAEHLKHLPVHIENGNATTSIVERNHKILYDRLISYYIQHGYAIPIDSQTFQKGLRERFIERDGMYFTPSQTVEYDEKRKLTDGFVPMGIIVSDEANGIEWLKNQLRDNPQTYQQIQPLWMQAIGDVRKGCILPELKTILEENFIEEDGGKWRIPNYEEALDLAKLHHKSLMRQFKYIVEMAQKPRARIKEANPEALREGFKQCFKDRDFATIMLVSEKIPQNMLTEDPDLLQYYDIAQMRV